MPSVVTLLPSILAADQSNLVDAVKLIESCGLRGVHIDSMDGHFVPNICIGPHAISDIRKLTNLFFDVHLMLTNPQNIVEAYLDAGSDRITVHAEIGRDKILACESKVRSRGKEFGLAINFGTSASAVCDYVDNVDSILVMSVKAGFSGQKFLPKSLEVVRDLAKKVSRIQIDGGIDSESFKQCTACDVRELDLILGSSFFCRHDEFKIIKEHV